MKFVKDYLSDINFLCVYYRFDCNSFEIFGDAPADKFFLQGLPLSWLLHDQYLAAIVKNKLLTFNVKTVCFKD